MTLSCKDCKDCIKNVDGTLTCGSMPDFTIPARGVCADFIHIDGSDMTDEECEEQMKIHGV